MDANQPENENLETVAAGDGATPNSPEAIDSTAEITRLKDELAMKQDEVLRARAEFQNFRKRRLEEEAKIREFATEKLVTALLPVLDNFERTIAHSANGASPEQIIEGIRAVERQLRVALESQNLKRIESVGQPFDPNIHDAIGSEVTSEYEPDTVTFEFEAGYRMGDKVIRPARVKVASAG